MELLLRLRRRRRRERRVRRDLAVELWQELELHLNGAGCAPERVAEVKGRAFVPAQVSGRSVRA